MSGTHVSWRFDFASSRMVLAVAVLVAGLQAVHAQRKSRAIDFSDPKDAASLTNFTASTAHNGLKDVEDELVKPLERSFNNPEPFDPGAPQAYVPSGAMMMPSRRARQLMDRKKNWEFVNPDELMIPGVSAEELSGVPEYTDDGQLKSSLSAMQQYFLSDTDAKKKANDKTDRQRTSKDSADRDKNQKTQSDDGYDQTDPNDPGDPDAPAGTKQADAKSGQSRNSGLLAVEQQDVPDSPQLSDMFDNGDSRDNSPDLLSKQAKLQSERLKSFEQAVGWSMPSATTTPASFAGSWQDDPGLFGVPSSPSASLPALANPPPISPVSSFSLAPAIPAYSDPGYLPAAPKPAAVVPPVQAPFANSGYALPKRAFQ